MKVAELLEQRRRNWSDLDAMCNSIKVGGWNQSSAAEISRFASLYRSACADLALAEAYHLPPGAVQYLHRLVARAHNQLYRSRSFEFSRWAEILLVETPQKIFNDRCMQGAFVVFWGIFLLSAVLAYRQDLFPRYADLVLTSSMQDQLHENFKDDIRGRDAAINYAMASNYITHNTGIGIRCFVSALLLVPGLYTLIFNAAILGGAFGYMARDPESGPNFFHFVTAHGPFELTAIVMSAGAGFRLGFSFLITDDGKPFFFGLFYRRDVTPGFLRFDNLIRVRNQTLPMMGAAAVLFVLAALTEGFLSPSGLPYWVKAAFAILSSGMLAFYFVVLGFPRGGGPPPGGADETR